MPTAAFHRAPIWSDLETVTIRSGRDDLSFGTHCGFTSYNYMSHVFQKSTGMSPREFRLRDRPRQP